ncbi:unnamed protein product [Paramecium sonneborni]|uniref:Transmembrane protein n=1 Tax=Paramecium sonneborni TaxID=65129 RepID=A0A8S1RRA7_9CILI|nr:unnamed protein product [Paramecium sonneborni]
MRRNLFQREILKCNSVSNGTLQQNKHLDVDDQLRRKPIIMEQQLDLEWMKIFFPIKNKQQSDLKIFIKQIKAVSYTVYNKHKYQLKYRQKQLKRKQTIQIAYLMIRKRENQGNQQQKGGFKQIQLKIIYKNIIYQFIFYFLLINFYILENKYFCLIYSQYNKNKCQKFNINKQTAQNQIKKQLPMLQLIYYQLIQQDINIVRILQSCLMNCYKAINMRLINQNWSYI